MSVHGQSQAHITIQDDLARLSLDARLYPPLHELAGADPATFPALLESSAGDAAQSRYDILLADPGTAITNGDFEHPSAFFDALDALPEQREFTSSDLPFVGGWLIYLGYEMARGVEPRLHLCASPDPLPDALALRCTSALIHDRSNQRIDIIAENRDAERVAELAEQLQRTRKKAGRRPLLQPPVARWSEDAPEHYLNAVSQAREYIHAGDVFQANLARSWHGELAEDVPPADVYAALRSTNPAPFSALLQWREAALVCTSPERLLALRNGWAEERPIAGTRRRLHGREAEVSQDLITDPKERAEHIMLIDLVRNDLGKICRPGSIEVDELMTIESYAHVHHIVSNVRGRLSLDVGPGHSFRAVFPGGTITGCPKVRCMEIIAELEERGRGAYTGSIGYLSRCGAMDSNIIIRSLTQTRRQMTLRTGAGIVADSQPQYELAETRHKARGVLRAFVDEQGRIHG